MVVTETWSTHVMHPVGNLQYLEQDTGQWKIFDCVTSNGIGTPPVRYYKHGEGNQSWLSMVDLDNLPKALCRVEKPTLFKLSIVAPYSYDGRERFKAHGRLWVLFAPDRAINPNPQNTLGPSTLGQTESTSLRWVRSLHRKTYPTTTLPFNYRAVLNPVLKAWLKVTLPDTNWGCVGCEAFYAIIVRGKPTGLQFKYASDNTARLYVNGIQVFDEQFGNRDWCTGRPCCGACCDNPSNCARILSGERWHTMPAGTIARHFTRGDNVIIWRVRQDSGGSGFHCKMKLSGATFVEPAPRGDATGIW